MRDFFSLDGSFNRYGGFVADTLILSLIWIFFSIPIFTIGAATSAMFYVSTRRIANREGYITSDFWQAFKTNFKRATLLWLIILGFALLLIFNIFNIEHVGGMAAILLPAQIIFLVEILFISVYVFPVTARFDMSLWQTIKSCFFMANRHLLTSLTCSVILIALFLGSWIMPLIFFAAPGVYAILASYMLMRIFKKYRPEMDRDPILELQELEAKRAEERRWSDIGSLEEGDESFTASDDDNIINTDSDSEVVASDTENNNDTEGGI